MTPPVLVQTCDRYSEYWGGFLHFMERHWDFSIPSRIFFANEEVDINLPAWCSQIKTGRGTFVENLKESLGKLGSDEVFLLLEDFWPIAPMSSELFGELSEEFRSASLDALQVSNWTPYYNLQKTRRLASGRRIAEFEPSSEWVFNFQARFWRTEKLLACLVEPEVSEVKANSAITVEIASDQKARSLGGLKAALFHYTWYPISGVAHRGQMSDFGKHLQNIVNIDRHVEGLFN